MTDSQIELGLRYLKNEYGEKTVNNIINVIENFRVEIPSWVFGDFGGGRFGGYTPPGYARNINEKLDDACFVNILTGAISGVATHILWDFSEDAIEGSFEIAKSVQSEAAKRGLQLGSVSPTLFLSGSHNGSLSSNIKKTREKALQQMHLSAKIAQNLANGIVTLWLPDGSNYPGQLELQKAHKYTSDSLKDFAREVFELNQDNKTNKVKVLIEYKVFEPGTYSTVLSDWGSAYLMAKEFKEYGGVLVDMGHHHHSTNIEQIIARLLSEGIYGGFHFNTRYAADDDHAVEPNQEMARIFYELINGGGLLGENDWALMIDQCSSREKRIHAVLHSIDSLQMSLAKALLVNKSLLKAYQENDEIILANRVFNDAILNSDVRPIIARARQNRNLPVNPLLEYVNSGYQKKIEIERTREIDVFDLK